MTKRLISITKDRPTMSSQTTKSRPVKAPTRYSEDTYSWVLEQIALLKAGHRDQIDAENIAEELSDLGNELRFRLESAIAVLCCHLLKWEHQPERRSRSWSLTVAEQRSRIELLLKRNPGLKGTLDEATRVGFASGRRFVLSETDLSAKQLPKDCPYTFAEMMTLKIVFDPDDSD